MDFSTGCILVNVLILWIKFLYIHTIIQPPPHNSSNIYITDGKIWQIYIISNHYYHGNLSKYQKFHENAEITLYCTGYITINTL